MATYANIQNKVYFLTKTNVYSFPNSDMAILANNALERITSLINQSDGRWSFDDTNQPTTDQGDGTGGSPIATTALVSGQQDYTFAVSHLNIERIEIKDSTGAWRKLTPIDQTDVYDQSITDFMSGGGTPLYYDKIGASLFLYPNPNYSQSASLKVFFTRGPIGVNTTDISSTTTKPGFSVLYHDLVALWIAYDYAVANGLPNANQLMADIQIKEDALKEDFTLRSRDEHIRLGARQSASGRGFFR